jgi:hypothetical protein
MKIKTTNELLDFISKVSLDLLDHVESDLGEDLVFSEHYVVIDTDGDLHGIMSIDGDYSEPGWNEWINHIDRRFPKCEYDVDLDTYVVGEI